MGHWLCIEVRRADATVDLVRRMMDSILVPPTSAPLWIVGESNFLANLRGFDTVATVFACLPLVTT